MRELGRVAYGHPYDLPDGWAPADPDLLDGALARTLSALALQLDAGTAEQPSRLQRYFDPERDHPGMTFNTLDRAAGSVRMVTSSDLLAVSLLDVEVQPRQVRQLLEGHPKRTAVTSALVDVPQDVALADFGSGHRDFAAVLIRLQRLYTELSTTPEACSGQWVFASKLCARKLPHLMPVRDTVVCGYIAGGPRDSPADLEHFTSDLQVFAFLMSHPEVRSGLKEVRSGLRRRFGASAEAVSMLRLLDVTLWMAAEAMESTVSAVPTGPISH